MNNRILAMLLAIIMIVSIVPVNAFATENAARESTHICRDNLLNTERESNGDGTHDAKCSVCGEFVGPYDCTYDDDKDYICNYCGAMKAHEHTDTSDGVCDVEGCEVHVHKIELKAETPANCTDSGNLAYYYCIHPTCGKVFKDAEGKVEGRQSDYILNPVHKDLEHRTAQAATCDADGWEAHTKCLTCGSYFSDQEAKNKLDAKPMVSAAGHKLKLVPAVDNTCKAQGNIKYYVCEVCGDYFEDEKAENEITVKDHVKRPRPLPDHTWGPWIYEGKNEAGHYRVCTVCGEEDTLRYHTSFKYENGKKLCVNCNFEVSDHICEDTSDCKCDECFAEMEHDVAWHSNGSGQHYSTCKRANCFKMAERNGNLTGWEACVDDDKNCVCDNCGYEFAHDWSTEIYHDEIGHYQVCKVCEAHSPRVDHLLGYGSAVADDNKTHTRTCMQAGCNYQVTEEHQDGGEVDHICGSCNAEMVHDTEWRSGKALGKAGKHYELCKLETCDNRIQTEWQDCVDENHDCVCDICGYEFECTWSEELSFDEEGHFRVCTNCGAENTKYAHDFSYGSAVANDNETHTRTCKHEDCNYQVVQNHNDGTKIDHICGSCNAEMVHDWAWEYGDLYHNQKCKVCDKKTNSELHVDEEAPFCECDVCGKELAHNGVYVEWLAETCTTDGHTDYYQCTKCGLKYLSNGQETDPLIPAPGHDWGEARVIPGSVYHSWHCQRPGCTGARIEMHVDENDDCVCDTCGAFAHGAIKYMPEKAATCTENGHQAYYYYDGCSKKFADEAGTTVLTELIVYGATGHNENGKWEPCDDGEHHEKYCVTCGEFLDSAEHVFNGENPYCVDCGAPDGLEFQPEVPATCTTNGTLAHYKSSITGRRYWDLAGTRYINDVSKLIIPAAHKLTDWTPGATGKHVRGCQNCRYTEEGTCSSNDTNCACDVCGGLLPGHTMTYVEAKEATCTKNGILASWYCAKCNKYYDANTLVYMPTVVQPALGHRVTGNWRNDATENAHSKYCIRCQEKITEAHELEVIDLYSGNLHEWKCTICDYSDSEVHKFNGDSVCDDCGHDDGKTVDVGSFNNHRETIKVKGDKDDTVEEKKSTWWKSFVDKLNPSYVGESQSSSAPSNSVENPLPNGSGISSGSTGASQATAPATTNSSTVGAVIDFLVNLLSDLFGL